MNKGTKGKPPLLKFAGDMIDSLLEGLELVDPETRMKVMELCGEACAREEYYGPALDIAKRIAEEETNIDRILERANSEILWCGSWLREGNIIHCTCRECGCPLIRNSVVKLRETFCYCSRGWVKIIFETLLRRPVKVELERTRGFGDDECRYVVYT